MVAKALIGPHIDIEKYRNLYRKIYPNSKYGNFEYSPEYRKEIEDFTLKVLRIHSDIHTKDPGKLKVNMLTLYQETKKFKENNYILIDYEINEKVEILNNTVIVPFGDFNQLFDDAFRAIILINKILGFDIDHMETENLKEISDIYCGEYISNMKTEDYNENESLFKIKGVKPPIKNLFD